MVTWIRIEPERELPIHHHPHEQIGVVLEGEIDLTIDGETRRVGLGGCYVVPGGLPHGGRTGAAGCLILESFSPPREDYLAGIARGAAGDRGD